MTIAVRSTPYQRPLTVHLECREWLADAWRINGYREADVHAIRYVGKSGELTFECVVETELAKAA